MKEWSFDVKQSKWKEEKYSSVTNLLLVFSRTVVSHDRLISKKISFLATRLPDKINQR